MSIEITDQEIEDIWQEDGETWGDPDKPFARALLKLQRERIVAELRAQADKGFSPNTGPTDWARALADFADHLEATR